MKQRLKVVVACAILALTVLAFAHYLANHGELLTQLTKIRLGTLALLVGLYLVWFLAIVLVLRASLQLLTKRIPMQENVLLNAYSSLVNFFGPGQSGVGLRGLYLKKRHDVQIKNYLFVTLLHYAFYAILSALMMFGGSRPWWQTVVLVSIASGGSFVAMRWFAARSKVKTEKSFNLANVGYLFAATVLLMLAQLCIFWIELKSVEPQVSLAQALTYTGTANFALFAALTPGAIGIREAFLLFSTQLHHLSSATIVAANVIDRSVYLVFLGLLFVLVMGLHAKDKLRIAHVTGGKARSSDE